VHRLRRLRTGLPGFRDLRPGRSAGEVVALYGTERGVLRALKRALRSVAIGNGIVYTPLDTWSGSDRKV
jgi:hypothetical protein